VVPGVAYPRCTAGRGETPAEDSGGIQAFNAKRFPAALDIRFDPEDLTDDLADLATHGLGCRVGRLAAVMLGPIL
jgi:hypothetical protein